MENAYIILAHKNPDQLYRLLNRLDDNSSTFFIHIDKKANLNHFKNLDDFGNKIIYVEREEGGWGSFGLVQATLNGLEAIKNTNKDFDYIHLLSGQDYPVKSNEYINTFLKESPHKIFITTFSALPVAQWGKGGLNRITQYYLKGLNADKWHLRLFQKFLNFSKTFIPPLRRKIPYGLTIYGGSQWWTIDMYAVNFILNYIEEHPKLIKFFKYSLISDEMFFQTILLNSKDERILKSMATDNKRYILLPLYNPHPLTLTKSDFDALVKSDALFARKFDPAVDAEVLDLIDGHCLHTKDYKYT